MTFTDKEYFEVIKKKVNCGYFDMYYLQEILRNTKLKTKIIPVRKGL